MNARSARILVTVAAFLAGLVLCFGVVLLVTGRLSAPVAQQAAAIGGPFKLTDQNGKTVTDQDLKGRPFLVFFGFTHCPDVCPTTLFDISEIMRTLGPDADRVRRAVHHRRSRARHAGRAQGLSVELRSAPRRASPASRPRSPRSPRPTASITRRCRSTEGGYTMDHTAIVYLMDKDGRFVSPFSLKRTTDAAAADLRRLSVNAIQPIRSRRRHAICLNRPVYLRPDQGSGLERRLEQG